MSTNILVGIFYVLVNALQASGAAGSSLVVNLSRQGMIYVPALFLLNSLLGIQGILWAQPVADVLAFLIAIVLNVIVYRKMVKEERVEIEGADGVLGLEAH